MNNTKPSHCLFSVMVCLPLFRLAGRWGRVLATVAKNSTMFWVYFGSRVQVIQYSSSQYGRHCGRRHLAPLCLVRKQRERDGRSTAGFSSSVQLRIPAHELVLPIFRVHLSTCLNLDCSHSPGANFT